MGLRLNFHPFIIPLRTQRGIGTLKCHHQFHLNARAAVFTPFNHNQTQDLSIYQYHLPHNIYRHASTKSASKHKPKLSKPPPSVPTKTTRPHVSGAQPILPPLSKLNPPTDTYAPEIVVPPRKPGQNRFSYWFASGKAYLSFYKMGISRMRQTAKHAKQLRAKQRENRLTRAEFQVVRRSRKDMMKIIPFGALLLLLGEWVPIIALWITPIVPEVCRIPGQVRKELGKLERRRRDRERKLAIDAANLVARDRRPGIGQATHSLQPPYTYLNEETLKGLDLYGLLTVSTGLDAHSKVWDWLFMTPPKSMLRWNVSRKLEYLRKDDELIARCGGWQGLNNKEVERACVERGIYVLGKSEGESRRDLAGWFTSSSK
ncbi:hypothetical protein CC78DRAFT_533951 [Lojkania enalia]|uniref:Letm1 RBD domain-containing protein n=1 Tax=Lojkania enalia TaxID=147567 RepID=A0A9P4K9G1_9PLEO|nr:hypothetical protein CC78DRAFT_533951 [Didymosphaeria enalia]